MEPTLPRSAYVDLEHFRAERERIFFRQWFCIGRQEEIPGAGDHLVCDIAGESIIVTRTRQGDLAGYYNLCRHRGSVLSADSGKPSQTEIGPTGTLCDLVPAFRQSGGANLDWENGIEHREGAWTFTTSGTTTRRPFPGLSESELTRHKGQLIYPNLMLSLSADHVAAFTLWPHGPVTTTVLCDFLFHPDEVAKPGFDPSDAIDFWDVVNRQDWRACELVQRGMTSRRFDHGFYAPMEDWSKDICRYIEESLE